MTVQEVQAAAAALAGAVTAAVRSFEASTGCLVHSLPIFPATKEEAAVVRVKVQIP